MSIFKCKMCGGTLEIQPGQTVVECEYCGTQQTLPKLEDDRRANLYDRANHFRRSNEFDKAMGIYEQILNEDNTDAESYWSLVLCRYGIEYVEDPATHKRVPTVNRAQFTSIFDDDNYKSALQYADTYQRSIYEEEAKAINEIQKGILAISQQEEPFDVFICYKESDNNGRRTPDSVLANDLYHQLTQEGFKVFFARITLEDKLGSAYEPYIFAALNSAKVMVVLGTRSEYFNAVWVKNEWSRYLVLIRQGEKKVLIPAYKDMDPYDLPEEFSHLQAQDMSKLGFMQDLIRGIKKITQTDEGNTTVVKETVITNGNADIAPLLKRVFMFLEDEDWKSADEYCERVLDIDPENASAYLGKLLAEFEVTEQEELKELNIPFDRSSNYEKVLRFADEKLKSTLIAYIEDINAHNEKVRLENTYTSAKKRMDSADTEQNYKKAAELFESIRGYLDAAELAQECLEKAETARKNVILSEGKTKMQGDVIVDYEAAIELFQSISGWEDADEKAAECRKKIAELKAKEEVECIERERLEENARKEKARIKKRNKKIAIGVCAMIGFLAVLKEIIIPDYIIPNYRYNNAIALIEAGEYEKAIAAIEELGDYKVSEAKISECKYLYATESMEGGYYREAFETFEELGDYKDSAAKILECQYLYAAENIEEGDYWTAIYWFEELGDYKDSAAKILECQYLRATKHMEKGYYSEAIDEFEELGDYKDSTSKLLECKYLYATESMEGGYYRKAIEAFEELDGYRDSAEQILYCEAALLENSKAGDYVLFGAYEQDNDTSNGKECIEWLVVDVQDDRVLVISKYGLDCKQYNEEYEFVTWETCTLRTWLNSEFINEAFSEEERAVILQVEIPSDNSEDNVTMDQIFLLNKREMEKYFNNKNASCYATDYAVANGARSEKNVWWLRSGSQSKETNIVSGHITYGVNPKAEVTDSAVSVRPALWIDLNALE